MDASSISMYLKETWATIYMTLISSSISYLIGIPLGVILVVTDKDGIHPMTPVHTVLGVLINIFRSIPFLILLVMVLPLTKMLVGTTLGPKAIIPPLIIASAPYIGRMVESSLKEVNAGVIEAAKSMGATNTQIIFKVLLPESVPSLVNGAAISVTTILGYTALASAAGGGGLGALAITKGLNVRKFDIMYSASLLLVVLVQIITVFGTRFTRGLDHKKR